MKPNEVQVALFPYHRDYGLDDSTRQTAVVAAQTKSVKQIANEMRLSESSIYKWIKDYQPQENHHDQSRHR
jgi:transposase